MKPAIFILTSAVFGALAYTGGTMLAGSSVNPLERTQLSTKTSSEFAPEIIPVTVPTNNGSTKTVGFAKTEVTFGDWNKCVDAGACTYVPRMRAGSALDHPVSGVSWQDTQSYIRWISSMTGQTFRLPRESEWRAAAVDVLDVKVEKLFDDPRMAWAADYVNFEKRSDRATKPVGHFGTTSNGVADLAGNVWEWTDTCWRSANSAPDDETIDGCGGVRVLAGAHMTYQSELIRVVPTGGCSIGFPPANIGFRLVTDSPQIASAAAEKDTPRDDLTTQLAAAE
jgi:formylglycine-generating enzyme required for sulfatase activity